MGSACAAAPSSATNLSCPAYAVRFTVWSNSSSGIASTASGAISCCAFASTGGERAGAIAGAVVGSPTCACICRTVAGSVIKPIRRTRAPLRQPRLQILTHHLIRRTPFRPPAYVHRGPLPRQRAPALPASTAGCFARQPPRD